VEAVAHEVILVSAGFDAHEPDSLSSTRVTADAYGTLTRGLIEVAGRTAHGRLVALLEGGYDLEGLALSAEEHVRALVEAPRAADR